MRLSVFGFHEVIYKFVIVAFVSLLSLACLYIYLNNETSTVGFILSTIYALALFLVSIYMTSMSNRVSNLYYRRQRQYINLKNLLQIYEKLNHSSDSNLQSTIIWHRVFVGRHPRFPKDKLPYVEMDGFTYKGNYLNLEEVTLNSNRNMEIRLTNALDDYLRANQIQTKSLYRPIDSFTNFLFQNETWRNKYLEINEAQLSPFVHFISDLAESVEAELSHYEKQKREFHLNNWLIKKRLESTIQKIEQLYGDRLKSEILEQDDLMTQLSSIEKTINTVRENLATYEDVEELIDDRLYQQDSNFNKIHQDLHHLSEIIEAVRDQILDEL